MVGGDPGVGKEAGEWGAFAEDEEILKTDPSMKAFRVPTIHGGGREKQFWLGFTGENEFQKAGKVAAKVRVGDHKLFQLREAGSGSHS